MKILIIAAGNSIHTVKWANAFVANGHNVTVVACSNHAPKENSFDSKVTFIALRFPSPFGYYLNAMQLKSIVKGIKPDIINIHYASGYATLGRLSRLKHALLNVWGSDVYDFPYESRNNMKIIKKNLNYFDAIASTSNCMANQTKKLVPRDNIYITPFGVDMSLFKPITGLRDNTVIRIGTVKTLNEKYGIKESILAFDNVIKELKISGDYELAAKLKFDIFGDGDQKEELQTLIDTLGYHNEILLKGYILNTEVPKAINTFDIFVCLSTRESFGVAAVESMASGVPVVASDADGLKEVVVDGVTGIITPKGDYIASSKALLRLIKDKALREELGKNGIVDVREKYNWSDNVNIMLNIYDKLISAKKE